MRSLLVFLLLAAVICHTCSAWLKCGELKRVKTYSGRRCILYFGCYGYSRFRSKYSYSFIKDDQPLHSDGHVRLYSYFGKVYFTRVADSDAGVYSFRISGPDVSCVKTIELAVLSPYNRYQNSPRYLSPNAAILKAISMERRRRPASNDGGSEGNRLHSSSMSSVIRRLFHPLGPEAVRHGKARSMVEAIVMRAMKFMDPAMRKTPFYGMPPSTMDEMMELAECIDSTSMFNCSVETVNQFRTIDGTCNNLERPLQGASNTAFRRILPAQYEDGIQAPIGHRQQVSGNPFAGPWPSARKVSRIVIEDMPVSSTGLSHIFMVFGQFVDHDLDLFGEFDTTLCEESCDLVDNCPICFPIKVEPNDPVFGVDGPNEGECLPITRSVGTCMQPFNSTVELARQQINQLTQYIDGSNVYGSTANMAGSLRLFSGGLLRQGGRADSLKGNLPFGPSLSGGNVPFFEAGDVRVNEHVALSVMHTVWLREHNRVVRELAQLNPCWDDERLYQEGRKIVGAIMQVIIYEEFLPTLFGKEAFKTYIGSYPGYSPMVDATVPNSFASAAYRFGHTLINPMFARLGKDGKSLPIGPLNLREAFFNPIQYFISGGTDPLLRGLLQDASREVDEFINRVLTSQLFAPDDDSLGMDLAARNIQRAREHGIPSYRQFQKFCETEFGVPAQFANAKTESRLRNLYGYKGFKNGIDLWVGGLAEERAPGANLGPTFACIIGKTFADGRNGDRFFWENEDIFNDDQRYSLSQIRFSKVICDNADDISTIKQNVFELGQVKEDCSDLPGVDLSLWKDETCLYY